MPKVLPPEIQEMLEKERLLTMPQVAQVLNVPVYTAREWGRRGIIPTIKLGRRVFVRASTFARWLKEREHGG